jgi:hypothetical protein
VWLNNLIPRIKIADLKKTDLCKGGSMKKKMIQIGKKTGLEVKEVNNLAKIGISGLLALTLSVFTAAWKKVASF